MWSLLHWTHDYRLGLIRLLRLVVQQEVIASLQAITEKARPPNHYYWKHFYFIDGLNICTSQLTPFTHIAVKRCIACMLTMKLSKWKWLEKQHLDKLYKQIVSYQMNHNKGIDWWKFHRWCGVLQYYTYTHTHQRQRQSHSTKDIK